MTNPETILTAIDGRDALAAVIIRPSQDDEGRIAIEAWASGISKAEAAFALRHVAGLWEAEEAVAPSTP